MRTQKQSSSSRHKITCEFCGGLIDVRQNDVCPNCGAAFHDSEQYAKYTKKQEELERLRMEAAQEVLEGIGRVRSDMSVNKTKQRAKVLKGMIIILVLFFILVPFLNFFSFVTGLGAFLPFLQNFTDLTLPFSFSQEAVVEAGFGETAETKKFSVKCDKMEEYRHHHRDIPAEGNYNVKLHLVITNKTDKVIRVARENSISCTYAQDGYVFSAKSISGFFDGYREYFYDSPIPAHTSVEGWLYFEVPEGADLTLNYTDDVTIHIPYENLQTP